MEAEQLLSEIQKLRDLLESTAADMVKSTHSDKPLSHLENAIDSGFSSMEGDVDEMSLKYRERVKIGVDENGKPVYCWASGNTKEELHKAIAALLNISANKAKAQAPVAVSLWEDYAKMWFDVFHAPNIRPKTMTKDASLFRNHIRPAFEGMRLDKITTTDAQNYLQSKAGYCKSQVRDIMWMLRAIFSSAVEDGQIAKNPMASSRICNPSQKEIRERKALSPEEQNDIIQHIDDILDPIARLFLAFLMFTSLRPCEIYGLKWEDVDFERRIVKVTRDLVFVNGKPSIGDTKTADSVRDFPIAPELYGYLYSYRSNGYIIGKKGNHITSDSVARKMWRRIAETIDLHGMTPYTGRHTYATNMSRAGIPIRTAMALMGHSDERMLLRTYTHVDNGDMKNASETMAKYISGLAGSQAQHVNHDVT